MTEQLRPNNQILEVISTPLTYFDQLIARIDKGSTNVEESINYTNRGNKLTNIERKELLDQIELVINTKKIAKELSLFAEIEALIYIDPSRASTRIDNQQYGYTQGLTNSNIRHLSKELVEYNLFLSQQRKLKRFAELEAQIIERRSNVAAGIENASYSSTITNDQANELRKDLLVFTTLKDLKKTNNRFSELVLQICQNNPKVKTNIDNAARYNINRTITSEDLFKLEKLLETLRSTPKEFRELISVSTEDRFLQALEFVQNLPLRNEQDLVLQNNLRNVIETLRNYLLPASAKQEITTLIENGRVERALQLIAQTPLNTETDRKEFAKLTDLALEVRRLNGKREILRLLTLPEIDFNRVFTTISALPTDQPADTNLINQLTNVALSAERDKNRFLIKSKLAPLNADIPEILLTIEGLPIRENKDIELKRELKKIVTETIRERIKVAVQLLFPTTDANTIVEKINELPEDDPKDIQLKKISSKAIKVISVYAEIPALMITRSCLHKKLKNF